MTARVVVLRDLGVGDLLVAVPALRLLRRALPDHALTLVAPPGPASLLDFAHVSDTRRHGDPHRSRALWAVNLHGRGPESHARLDALAPTHRVGHAAPGWDGPPWSDDPGLPERRRWCDLLAACGLVSADEAAAGADDVRLAPPPPTRTGHVVVHPGAAFGSKRWPVERFAAVAGALRLDGHDVVVTGGPDERHLTAAVPGEDLGGRTDLPALAALVAGARLVVCGDTGIAHLATAYGTPSVVLFGPVGPQQWGPPPDGPHTVLTDPDLRRGKRFADDPDPALLAVRVGDVLAAASTLLA